MLVVHSDTPLYIMVLICWCLFIETIGFRVIVPTLNGGEASTSHDASKSTSAAGAGATMRCS